MRKEVFTDISGPLSLFTGRTKRLIGKKAEKIYQLREIKNCFLLSRDGKAYDQGDVLDVRI